MVYRPDYPPRGSGRGHLQRSDVPQYPDENGEIPIYRHEIENAGHGGDYPWAESGPITIGEGDQVIKATQVLTDSIPANRVTLEFKTRFQPQGDEVAFGPYDVLPQTDVRFTGRQMRMRVNVIDDPNGSKDVRIGDMRVLVGGGGRR